MIPIYQPNGNLPPGIYKASWQEFIDRFGFNDHRKQLVEGLYQALANLKAAGCATAYINGSFVTSKSIPKDFDACWDRGGVNLHEVDPILLDFSNNRAAQKAKYGGELFPNIKEATSELYFLNFFQLDKDDTRKGIIQIDLGALP
jgi:hypothetical protein